MASEYPPHVGKIVEDYVDRLAIRLRGMPRSDQGELLGEVRSHIYESYGEDPTQDEVERILKVLRKLGEPDDVISSRIPTALSKLARGRFAPMYVVAGVFAALVGVPLGLGAVAVLVGLLAGMFGLIVGYFGAAVSLVVAGFAAAVACGIAAADPDILYAINGLVGQEVVQFGPFQNNPELAGWIGLAVSLLVAAVGLVMLWGGKHLWRGFSFLVVLIVQKVRSVFARLAASRSQPVRIPV